MFQSISLSIYLSTYLSIFLSIYLILPIHIYISSHPFINQFINTSWIIHNNIINEYISNYSINLHHHHLFMTFTAQPTGPLVVILVFIHSFSGLDRSSSITLSPGDPKKKSLSSSWTPIKPSTFCLSSFGKGTLVTERWQETQNWYFAKLLFLLINMIVVRSNKGFKD